MEDAMESNKRTGTASVRVCVEDDGWFVEGENGWVGPFDRVYDICMSTCFLGGSICESKELSGEAMAELLWPLMADR